MEQPEEVRHEALDQLQISLDEDGIGNADLILVPRPHEFLVQLTEGRGYALPYAKKGKDTSSSCSASSPSWANFLHEGLTLPLGMELFCSSNCLW